MRQADVAHFPSGAEVDLAMTDQGDDGLALKCAVGGLHGSSTRTELAAAIIAIAANGPIHIGTDRQAMLDKASKILHIIKNGESPAIPWCLMDDGDLWYHWYQAAKAKGPEAIRLSKVKGHATAAQVNAGEVRKVDQVNNVKVDDVAGEAVELHGDAVLR